MITLRNETKTALEKLHIQKLTRIQETVIPHALNQEDIYALSPTGSGKTYAFLLPILERIELQGKGKHFPKALILAPTRELCIQITNVIRNLLQNREGIRTALLTGGYDMQKQIRSFKNGADIVVGTPSRVKDHLRRHTLKAKMCDILVLDEADMMLSMGFEEDVKDCIAYLPEHQTLLFSATETDETAALASSILHSPYVVSIKKEEMLKQDITLHIVKTNEKQKIDYLISLLKKEKKQCILFCNTKKTCDFLTGILQSKHMHIETIHSDMDYKQRKQTMNAFRNGDLSVLCATDVASRGIDIPSVDTVIMYDVADTEEQLIHRTGRCSRDGKKANAYLFVTKKDKAYNYNQLFEKVVYKK